MLAINDGEGSEDSDEDEEGQESDGPPLIETEHIPTKESQK